MGTGSVKVSIVGDTSFKFFVQCYGPFVDRITEEPSQQCAPCAQSWKGAVNGQNSVCLWSVLCVRVSLALGTAVSEWPPWACFTTIVIFVIH